MRIFTFGGYVFSVCAVSAMLAGCGAESTPLSPSPAGVMADRTHAPPAYRVLYNFDGRPGGAVPAAGLINVNGTLYGTTESGGKYACSHGHSCCCGTVYSISASGEETVLHRFKGGSGDGADPVAPLLNVNGTLYGTTFGGGDYSCNSGAACGTVFAITTSGKETVLYSFKGGTADGAYPYGALLNVGSTLYGTTGSGGTGSSCGRLGCGTVFSITMSGKETVLYFFKGGTADGGTPYAGLINIKGTLYGTTAGGGANGDGTVFSITTSGKETVRYSFKGGEDGQSPQAGLVYRKGRLYGTTSRGGLYSCSTYYHGCGTVFSTTPSGTEQVLHRFSGYPSDGEVPQAAILDIKGTLYGTTLYGGTSGYGTVFEILASGKERVLHNFVNEYTDGIYPVASLVNVNGTLYGTTESGGEVLCGSTIYSGCGTVFELKP